MTKKVLTKCLKTGKTSMDSEVSDFVCLVNDLLKKLKILLKLKSVLCKF